MYKIYVFMDKIRSRSVIFTNLLNFRFKHFIQKQVKKILKYYSSEKISTIYNTDEQAAVSQVLSSIEYIYRKHGNTIASQYYDIIYSGIPEKIRQEYKNRSLTVEYDKANKLNFILVDNKKIYFKRNMTETQIKDYFNLVSLEQDIASPHRYLSCHQNTLGVINRDDIAQYDEDFLIKPGDIVADIGAAEGIFALSIVDIAEKIYIFECDDQWYEALQYTFQPYNHKVEIIKKYVSSTTDEKKITLDDYFKNKKVDVLKLDIEGAEEAALSGAQSLISSSDTMKITCCVYHRHNDERIISGMLQKFKYTILPPHPGAGRWMVCLWEKREWLRRGIIRAVKNPDQIC